MRAMRGFVFVRFGGHGIIALNGLFDLNDSASRGFVFVCFGRHGITAAKAAI